MKYGAARKFHYVLIIPREARARWRDWVKRHRSPMWTHFNYFPRPDRVINVSENALIPCLMHARTHTYTHQGINCANKGGEGGQSVLCGFVSPFNLFLSLCLTRGEASKRGTKARMIVPLSRTKVWSSATNSDMALWLLQVGEIWLH